MLGASATEGGQRLVTLEQIILCLLLSVLVQIHEKTAQVSLQKPYRVLCTPLTSPCSGPDMSIHGRDLVKMLNSCQGRRYVR